MHPEKIPTHPLESSDPGGQWRWRCKWTILLKFERKAQSEPCLRENTESLKAGWCDQGSTSLTSMSEEIPEAAETVVRRMSPQIATSLVSCCEGEAF